MLETYLKIICRISSILFLVVIFTACKENRVIEKKDNAIPYYFEMHDKSMYPDSTNSFNFSGFRWLALDSQNDYDLQHFCESDPQNVYVDNTRILKLKTSGGKINKRGVIVDLDTILGYGVYSFDLISSTKNLSDFAEFSFSLINLKKSKSENISELGIKFSYSDHDSLSSPLQYYLFSTTDRIPYEFYHEEKYPTLDLTKHLIEIDKGFVRLASFEGFLDYQSSEFFEYTFEFSENDMELEVPNKVKIRLSLCLKPEYIEDITRQAEVEILNINFTESEVYYSRY